MMSSFIKGIYRDVLTDKKGQAVWQSGWRPNLVVRECARLNAALMKGHQDMKGILFWAVGAGEKNWDSNPPRPGITTTQLIKEVYRLSINGDQIAFLDDTGAPADSPTNQLEVTAEFKGAEITPDQSLRLREFGLFGGDASGAPGSGFMIDYVIHPRIDLHRYLTLTRKLQLSFTETTLAIDKSLKLAGLPEMLGCGANLPVEHIAGVGDKWANLLRKKKVRNLQDLANIDPLVPIGKIPRLKLMEFRAKAQMVMNFYLNLAYIRSFSNVTLSTILKEKPGRLLRIIGSPYVTGEMIVEMQQQLAVLQVALDDASLQRIKLKQLMEE